MTINLSCGWCGARKSAPAPTNEAAKALSTAWVRQHIACAKGPSRVVLDGDGVVVVDEVVPERGVAK